MFSNLFFSVFFANLFKSENSLFLFFYHSQQNLSLNFINQQLNISLPKKILFVQIKDLFFYIYFLQMTKYYYDEILLFNLLPLNLTRYFIVKAAMSYYFQNLFFFSIFLFPEKTLSLFLLIEY